MHEAPPIQRVESGRTAVFVWMGAIALVLGTALLFVFDPSRHAFYPRCFLKLFTGLNCPGCGGLRATHQLLHGNLRAALELNSLFVLSLPVMAFLISRAGVERLTGRKWRRLTSPTTAIWIGGVIVIAFGVLRNIPWQAWLGS